MSKFTIQKKSIMHRIWYNPESNFERGPAVMSANSVAELRESIRRFADSQTLNFTLHFRIITSSGDPVERWKTRPGKATKTWRKQ